MTNEDEEIEDVELWPCKRCRATPSMVPTPSKIYPFQVECSCGLVGSNYAHPAEAAKSWKRFHGAEPQKSEPEPEPEPEREAFEDVVLWPCKGCGATPSLQKGQRHPDYLYVVRCKCGMGSCSYHAAADAARNWNLFFGGEPQKSEPEPGPTLDGVEHPSHYTSHPSGVECIEITEHLSFCRGNAIKYLWRAGSKDEVVEDLQKARWYISREIERLERAGATQS
jgi:hypothetical protein